VDACNDYVRIADKIGEIKFTRTQLINLAKQKWESYSDMSSELPPAISESVMKETYKQFSTYFAKSAALYQKAQTEAAVYKELLDDEGKKGVDAYLDAIKKASNDLEKGHEYLYEDNFLKLIEDVLVLQDAMDNESYFTVISPPIQMDGDFVFFNIKTTPAKTNDLMPYEFGRTFPVEIPIKGGLKVDFSVGPVFSFGDNARDEKFFFDPVGIDGTQVTLQQRKNNNAISPGIAAMMHFYRRSGKNMSVGGMFGVGAGFQSIEDANLSFYFGPSVVLGKREKLMLNTGVSYLSVERLKNGQNTVGETYASSLSLNDVTEKVIKPSFFLGISYNLTNRIEVK
jgi:hypothetical protein